ATGPPARLLPRRAHHEPLAALRAPPLEDPPPRSRRIALAKPVLAVAADLARLVGALHDGPPPESEKRGKKACATGQVKERPRRTTDRSPCKRSGPVRHRSAVDPATLEIPLDPLSPRLLGSAALNFSLSSGGHSGEPTPTADEPRRALEGRPFSKTNSRGTSDAWLLVHSCEQQCGRLCGSEFLGVGTCGNRPVDTGHPPPEGAALPAHVPDLFRAHQARQPGG